MSDGRVEMRGVWKTYRRGGEVLTVLDSLDLDVPSGAFFAMMGPSGSNELAAWRARNVGFVFQSFNLIPVLTALENVELPLLLQPLSKAERRKHAEYALEVMGLKDRMRHRPSQLSGGQEQRVAIARAIATDPAVIVADEPTGDLDRASADHVLELLRKLSKESKKTVLMVTHDPAAAACADKILNLHKGTLVTETAA